MSESTELTPAGVRPAIGIVGVGTVGKALVAAFRGTSTLMLRDPVLGEDSRSMADLVEHCEVIFFAVPTPMAANTDVDLTAFESAISELLSAIDASSARPVVCIKSTVPPDRIARLGVEHPLVRLTMSPEFLREASPIDDMLAMRALVVGGAEPDTAVVVNLFKNHSNVNGPMRTSTELDAVGAALLKYQQNCFLATKVSFMNEFADVLAASSSTASWEAIQAAFHLDHERMGTSHWRVPGPDGMRGWGGKCLPKDMAGLRAFAARNGAATPLLDAVTKRNRSDRNGPD